MWYSLSVFQYKLLRGEDKKLCYFTLTRRLFFFVFLSTNLSLSVKWKYKIDFVCKIFKFSGSPLLHKLTLNSVSLCCISFLNTHKESIINNALISWLHNTIPIVPILQQQNKSTYKASEYHSIISLTTFLDSFFLFAPLTSWDSFHFVLHSSDKSSGKTYLKTPRREKAKKRRFLALRGGERKKSESFVGRERDAMGKKNKREREKILNQT